MSVVNGVQSVLKLQTIAMTTRDSDTDVLVPITVQCTGIAPPAGKAINEYQISLVPVPTPDFTE